MASIVSGYVTEQLVVTVANNDTDINAEISVAASDNWLVSSLTLSDTNVIILFTRTVASA